MNLNYFEPIRIFRYGNVLIVFPKKEFSLVYILNQKLYYREVDPLQEISLERQPKNLGTI